MCKLLACDLDGTLFYPRKMTRCIPVRNVRFLRRWIDAGNKVVLITSRSYEYVQKLEKEIKRPVDVMSCNSSKIHINGEMVKHVWMPNDELKKVFDEIDKRYLPLGYLITAEDHPCVIYNPNRRGFFFMIILQVWYFFQFKYREKNEINNDLFIELMNNGKCYKMMTFFGFGKKKGNLSKEINKALRENFPEIESSWSLIVNELTAKGCNKGEGLEQYCKLANIKDENVYVVGDSGNDIAMFTKYHEHSYCMAHAYPSVKKYAKYAITRVHKLDKLVLKGEK